MKLKSMCEYKFTEYMKIIQQSSGREVSVLQHFPSVFIPNNKDSRTSCIKLIFLITKSPFSYLILAGCCIHKFKVEIIMSVSAGQSKCVLT